MSEFCALQWCAWRALTDYLRQRVGKPSHLLRRALCVSALIPAVALASRPAISDAENLFQLREFDAAFERFRAVQLDPYSAPADLALARCRMGIIYSIRDQQKQARQQLELALSSNALASSVTPLCFYALVQIYVMDKSFTDARGLMKRYPDPAFPALYKARIFALGTEIGRQLGDLPFELNQLQRLSRVMEIADIKKVDLRILGDWVITADEVRQRLGESVASSNPTAKDEPQAPVVSNKPVEMPKNEAPAVEKAAPVVQAPPTAPIPIQPVQSFDGLPVMSSLQNGLFQQAYAELNAQPDALSSKNFFVPQKLLRDRLETLLRDDPRSVRVGVILPEGSGLFSRLQLRALKGISAFLASRAAKDVDYRVYVKSVGNDSGSAEQAATDLVLNDQVHIIVGPFHGSQVLGAASVASFFGVPIFTLGPVAAADEFNENFVVRMGILAQSQARAQVQYLKQTNKNTVAVLSPSDSYGVEMTKAFESECKAAGVAIQSVEFVDVNTEVFQDPVRALLGPQDVKHRGPEYAKLLADARRKAASEKRKFDPTTLKLPAHVPFSALYVPDSLDRVRLIANTFAFYDARTVRYLGERTWHEAGGRASIADQFLNGARVPFQGSGSFLSVLRKDLSAGVGALDIERQAFDSLLLTRTAHYNVGGNNPVKLIASMKSPSFSADGTSKFGPVSRNGEPLTEFVVSQFYNGQVLSPNTSIEALNDEVLEN